MSDRYQKEIEEILRKAGDLGDTRRAHKQKPGFWQLVWLNVKHALGGKAWSISPARLMLLAVVLLLSALIIRPFGLGLVGPLAWAGLLLFIVAYGLFFVRPPRIEKRWRGQALGSEDSWWERFRRKMK